MSGVFGDLFLDGKADELKPVEALSLYYDYRELTPIGRRGDDMVRKLADRLISVDLLAQAAELLQHQIDNRLRGAARAQIAADLAVVYLLDKRPTEALQVIRRTEQAQLPMLLDRQRRIVEARALADLKETRSALDLLSSMEGDDISRMRAEIFWAADDWRGVAAQVERMMGGRWSDELPLNDRERRDVLRAGIAYALVDDAFGLERIRKKYLAKMADGPDGAAFDAVTRPIEVDSPEFKEIVKQTAATDTMGAFLAEYRARYLKGAPAVPGTDSVVTSGIGG
jgi:phytoene dehydrogenase-like protein